jgi:hypothetical protein
MGNFAVFNGDMVINTIIAESKEVAESVTGRTCVEYTSSNPAFIGAIWNGESYVFPEPPVIVEEVTDTPEEISAPVVE